MKRFFTVLLVLSILVSSVCYGEEKDYFEDMTLEELLELKEKVDTSIQYKKKHSSSNDFGIWSKKYYIDKFNNPTDDAYISTTISGTFSNSATNNSSLLVKFIVDTNGPKMFLYEYGSSQVKNGYSSKGFYYDMYVLDEAGNTTRIIWKMKEGQDRFYIYHEEDIDVFINLLKDNISLSFYVVDENNSLNKYNFKINNTLYFDNAYISLFPAIEEPVIMEDDQNNATPELQQETGPINDKSSPEHIQALQERLVELGWLDPSDATGVYNQQTIIAVIAFQDRLITTYGTSLFDGTEFEQGYADEITLGYLMGEDAPVPEPTPEPQEGVYRYRIDEYYFTAVDGVIFGGYDFQETGVEQTTEETTLTIAVPESQHEGYTFDASNANNRLTQTFTSPDTVYTFQVIYIRQTAALTAEPTPAPVYSYRVDQYYFTAVDGVISGSYDDAIAGDVQTTTEASISVSAPASAHEGYVFDESNDKNLLSARLTNPDELIKLRAIYVKWAVSPTPMPTAKPTPEPAPEPPQSLNGTKWVIESITEDGITQPISDFTWTETMIFGESEVTVITDSNAGTYQFENSYPYSYTSGVATVLRTEKTSDTFTWIDGKLECRNSLDAIVVYIPVTE